MSTFRFFVALLLLTPWFGYSNALGDNPPQRDVFPLQAFLNLFHVVAPSEENTVLSSAQLFQSLTLLGIAARGEAQSQILDFLGSPSSSELFLNFKEHSAKLQSPAPKGFHSAFVWNKSEPYEKFESFSEKYFHIPLFEGSYDDINLWAGEKTDKSIQDFIPVYPPCSSLMVYSIGELNFDFVPNQADVVTAPFYPSPSVPINTQFIHWDSPYQYFYNDSLQAVFFDHACEEIVSVFVLPSEAKSSSSASKFFSLTKQDIQMLFDNYSLLAKRPLSISVPVFQFDYRLELKNPLKRLGIKDVFSPSKNQLPLLSTFDTFLTDYIFFCKFNLPLPESPNPKDSVGGKDPGMFPPLKVFFDRPFYVLTFHKSNRSIISLAYLRKP